MPAAAAIPAMYWLVAGSTVATGAGQIYGAKKANEASKRAQASTDRATRDAMDLEKSEIAKRDAEFATAETERKAAWQAEEDRLAPYREQQENAMRRYSELTGIPVPQRSMAATTMPKDWGVAAGTAPDPSKGGYAWSAPQPTAQTPPQPLPSRPPVNFAQSVTPQGPTARQLTVADYSPSNVQVPFAPSEPRSLSSAVRFRRPQREF